MGICFFLFVFLGNHNHLDPDSMCMTSNYLSFIRGRLYSLIQGVNSHHQTPVPGQCGGSNLNRQLTDKLLLPSSHPHHQQNTPLPTTLEEPAAWLPWQTTAGAGYLVEHDSLVGGEGELWPLTPDLPADGGGSTWHRFVRIRPWTWAFLHEDTGGVGTCRYMGNDGRGLWFRSLHERFMMNLLHRDRSQ